jgi:hypothetical protein
MKPRFNRRAPPHNEQVRGAWEETAMKQAFTPELAKLVDAHRAAFAEFEATDDEADEFIGASRAEDLARYDVAMRPCANDSEFIEKLRYLLATECSLWGEPEFLTEFGSVVIAVREHLDRSGG